MRKWIYKYNIYFNYYIVKYKLPREIQVLLQSVKSIMHNKKESNYVNKNCNQCSNYFLE